jgi:hypothetical protein
MTVTKEYLEYKKIPEKFPEIKRFMAFCESTGQPATYHDDPGFIGICLYDLNGHPITKFGEYTMCYDTTAKKYLVLGNSDVENGMSALASIVSKFKQKEDVELIDSLGSGLF